MLNIDIVIDTIINREIVTGGALTAFKDHRSTIKDDYFKYKLRLLSFHETNEQAAHEAAKDLLIYHCVRHDFSVFKAFIDIIDKTQMFLIMLDDVKINPHLILDIPYNLQYPEIVEAAVRGDPTMYHKARKNWDGLRLGCIDYTGYRSSL